MSKTQDILLMAGVALYALLTVTRLLSTCAQFLQTKPQRRTAVARESYRFSSKGKVVSGLAQWRAGSGM